MITRALGQADRWLFAPVPAARLRFCATGLLVILALRLAVPPYHELGGQPAALFEPPAFLAWLPGMPSATVLLALQAIGLVAVGVAFAGPARRRRLAFALAWACLLVLAGLRASRGKIMHNDLLLLFVCVPFLAQALPPSPGGGGGGDGEGRPALASGWPLHAGWVVIAMAYGRAGLGKVLTSGWEWVFSDNMRWILRNAVVRGRAPTDAISTFVLERPWLAVLVAATLLLFELSGPLVLVSAGARPAFAVAAVALHLGTWLAIGLDYSAWALVVPLLLVDWRAVGARLAPRLYLPVGRRALR